MSLKLQQTSGTGGSGSGRRIGPASKTNRSPADIIDVDSLDDIPLAQTINQQKSTNQSNEIKTDIKKSLIPLPNNEKTNQISTNEIKNVKESNSSTTDKKDNNKNTEKNGHNNEQSKLQTPTQKESSLKSTNGHKNDDSGNNKKLNQLPTNGNGEQKNSKTKDDKPKTTTSNEQITISATTATTTTTTTNVIESEKPGPKSKKLSEKDKKKTNNEEITNTNNDVPSQPQLITPPKRTSQRAAAIQANASLASLANEKELKGFNEIGDEEMESLLLQIDTSEEIDKTKPILTPTKSNIVEKKNNNDQENKKIDDSTTTKSKSIKKSPMTVPFSQSPITSTPDTKQQHSYLPRPTSTSTISGRRSLRPINKEYSFQNTSNYRESYRKIQTEFDYTGNTSLNVTVGSEITQPDQLSPSISTSSFSFFGRGKKRERTSPQQPSVSRTTTTTTTATTEKLSQDQQYCQLINGADDNELDTSVSKRARLDFSGFFGIVASPVTMLRARLSRAKIQSTPKFNDNDDVEDGIETFSGIIGDDKKNDNLDNNMDNSEDNQDEEDVEIEEISMKDDEQQNDMKNIKEINDDDEDNEIIVTEIENRRRMCLLM